MATQWLLLAPSFSTSFSRCFDESCRFEVEEAELVERDTVAADSENFRVLESEDWHWTETWSSFQKPSSSIFIFLFQEAQRNDDKRIQNRKNEQIRVQGRFEQGNGEDDNDKQDEPAKRFMGILNEKGVKYVLPVKIVNYTFLKQTTCSHINFRWLQKVLKFDTNITKKSPRVLLSWI